MFPPGTGGGESALRAYCSACPGSSEFAKFPSRAVPGLRGRRFPADSFGRRWLSAVPTSSFRGGEWGLGRELGGCYLFELLSC